MPTPDTQTKAPTPRSATKVTPDDPRLQGLLHIGVKTGDLKQTLHFYCELLGMTEVWRPPFDYPGAWLASSTPDSILIHVYAGKAALDSSGHVRTGTNAIDHVAIGATGFHAMRSRMMASGRAWRQHIPPNTEIWQLFMHDPNGIMIELNFDGPRESGSAPTREDGPWYTPGEDFFKPYV